ncbi:MAG TPA: acyltransferase [Acidimicrobiales bacterium]|nr:acyltransferase [Acidimicrobiales bacterium]
MSTAAESPVGGTRQRLEHIDAMRPIKQTAVISTHALIFFSPLSTSFAAGAFLTLTHFSRDAFLFVSACMLAYSYREQKSVKIVPYWKRRSISVGLPYLAWSLIYFPISMMLPTNSFPYYRVPWGTVFSLHGAHELLIAVATGYYHLYFLLVLLEFYVLFPLLLKLLRSWNRWHLPILLVALAWQIMLQYAVRHGHAYLTVAPKTETRLVFSYPLYLIGGVIAALHLDAMHAWIVRRAKAILIGTVLCAIVPVAIDAIHRRTYVPKFLIPGGDPFSPMVIPYDVGAIFCVYLLGVYLVSPRRSLRTRAITQSGSDAAYGIYLSQMLWILFLHRWSLKWGVLNHVPWLVMMLFALTFAYMSGFLFSALVARTPLARALVGRSQVPWNTLIPHFRSYVMPLRETYNAGPMDLSDV